VCAVWIFCVFLGGGEDAGGVELDEVSWFALC
jgi:hypothetical protein